MHTVSLAVLFAAVCTPFSPWLPSDPAAAYAVIDKAVLLPSAAAPTSIELHGAFALAEGLRGQYYRAPRIGVLRFGLGKDADACVQQWRAIAAQAGTGAVVSFGSRYETSVDGATPLGVRTADEPAGTLPAYSTGWDVRVLENVDYGPARQLRLLPRCLPVDLGKGRSSAERPERPVVFQCTNCQATGDDLRYVFCVETSDGERFASSAIPPGQGTTSWTTNLALQVGETIAWSVHVVGGKVERAPVASDRFVVPAAVVERKG
jgi:hypothetical protein